jgi:hypothetical protein
LLTEFVPDGRHILLRRAILTSTGSGAYSDTAIYALDGRLVRRIPEMRDIAFDPSARSVAVLHNPKPGPDRTHDVVVTIHDLSTWLAGGAKKE